MKQYITIAALMVAGIVQADVAPVTGSVMIRGGGNSNTVYNVGTMDLKNAGGDGSFTRITVFKLDLSGISGTVDTASFAFNAKSPGDTLNVFAVNDAATGQDWDQTTASWASFTTSGLFAPQASDMQLGGANLTELASFVRSASGSYFWNTVSGASLVSALNADTDGFLTLVFATDANLSSNAIRDEGTAGTELTYTVIPEPATLGLISLAGVVLIAARRFRV